MPSAQEANEAMLRKQIDPNTEIGFDGLRYAVALFVLAAHTRELEPVPMFEAIAAALNTIHFTAMLEFSAHLRGVYRDADLPSPALEEGVKNMSAKVKLHRNEIIKQIELLMECRDPEIDKIN